VEAEIVCAGLIILSLISAKVYVASKKNSDNTNKIFSLENKLGNLEKKLYGRYINQGDISEVDRRIKNLEHRINNLPSNRVKEAEGLLNRAKNILEELE